MSNFFEQELRKLFEDGQVDPSSRFVGRACLGDLGGDLRVRAEFVTTDMGYSEALRLTVLKRTDGEVDRLVLGFRDVIGMKQSSTDPKLSSEVSPCIRNNYGTIEWYPFQPADADYQALRRAAGDYLEMFRERTPEQERPAPVRRSPGRSASRKGRDER